MITKQGKEIPKVIHIRSQFEHHYFSQEWWIALLGGGGGWRKGYDLTLRITWRCFRQCDYTRTILFCKKKKNANGFLLKL